MINSTSQPTLSRVKLERIKEARKTLEINQIFWTEHALATHFILHLTDQTKEDVDFWPTTGRFYSSSNSYKGRGLNNMIEFINKHFPLEE